MCQDMKVKVKVKVKVTLCPIIWHLKG